MLTRVPTPLISAAAKAAPEMARLREAARQTEALFLKDLLKSMRQSMGLSGAGAFGGKQFEEIVDQAFADHLSKATDLGIRRMMTESLGRRILAQAAEEARR